VRSGRGVVVATGVAAVVGLLDTMLVLVATTTVVVGVGEKRIACNVRLRPTATRAVSA
jgi:hypothetical protein